eukprot:scaffold13602_cov214-Alexandrium_tamarense.AAC.3
MQRGRNHNDDHPHYILATCRSFVCSGERHDDIVWAGGGVLNGGERARVRADGGPVALECAVECKYYYYRAGWGQWCSCKRGGMLVVDSQSVSALPIHGKARCWFQLAWNSDGIEKGPNRGRQRRAEMIPLHEIGRGRNGQWRRNRQLYSLSNLPRGIVVFPSRGRYNFSSLHPYCTS